MPKDERDQLLKEIEQIRTTIEQLQPELREREMSVRPGVEAGRANLISLRKALAHDMELLHAG